MSKKRRRKRIKPPNAKITRNSEVKSATVASYIIDSLNILEYHPDDEAKEPATQVHVQMQLKHVPDPVFMLRFKKPEILGFFIEELIAYRKNVWSEAEPINPDVSVDDLYFEDRDYSLLEGLEEISIGDAGHYRCESCQELGFLMTDGSTMVVPEEYLSEIEYNFSEGFDPKQLPGGLCPKCVDTPDEAGIINES